MVLRCGTINYRNVIGTEYEREKAIRNNRYYRLRNVVSKDNDEVKVRDSDEEVIHMN